MAELRNYDIAGAAQQGYAFGNQIKQQREGEQRRNRLSELAGQAYGAPAEQRQGILQQAVSTDPEAGLALGQGLDDADTRRNRTMANMARMLTSAPEQSRNGLYQRMRPSLEQFGLSNLPQQYDATVDQAAQSIVQAYGGAGGGTGVQSTYVDGEGNRVAIMRDGSTTILGKNDAGATQQTISIAGPDGRPAQYTFDRRTGNYVPAGAGMAQGAPQSVPQASPQGQGVTQFTGPDGMPVQIGDDVPEHVRQQILANPQAFQEVPDGSMAQMPDRRVSQFSGGARVPQGGSPFVGQSPAEKAASEAAARAQVELSYAPAMQGVQTQGAIERARGEAQVQTESTLQRDEAKRQAERVQGLPQLQEQRRVLNDALQGLGTKYRTGPVNTVIPDALQSADNQVFMTVVNNAVLDAASKLTGVISDKDMEFLRRATVNLDTREDANREILRRQLRIIDEGIQKAQGGPTQQTGGGAPARVQSADDYSRLPSGAMYIAPDGTQRRKR